MATKPKTQKRQDSTRMECVIPGSGDPNTDLTAVQTAVNAGQDVSLVGTFNFGTGQVKIRGRANISGLDKSGNKAVIEGGKPPFVVDTITLPVSIRGIVFRRPQQFAIEIKTVTGLVVADCKVEGPITPTAIGSGPQAFMTAGGIMGSTVSFRTADSGIAGVVDIDNNEIDVDPDSSLVETYSPLRTFGIQLNLGDQTPQATITIRRNTVKNVTAHGVILRGVTGTAVVGGIDNSGNSNVNEIVTGSFGGRIPNNIQSFVDGIMCEGGSQDAYTISNNIIDSGYKNSAGIRLVSTIGTRVDANQIRMSSQSPADPINDLESAAVELRRNCEGNQVQNQQISGQARAVLSVLANNGNPKNNRFSDNDHGGFNSSLKDIVIGSGALSTTIENGTGGTLQDDGTKTEIFPDGNYQ